MEAYKTWVRRNKDYVHSLESLTNGLTWVLPERFLESEIGPEAVSSILGIITTINGHILKTPPIQTQATHVEPSSFPFSLCITILKGLETLVEVAAEQYYGEEKKWNFLAFTEAIKVLLRLAILQKSGYKMLLHGGETLNDGDESDSFDTKQNTQSSQPQPQGIPSILKNYNELAPWNLEGRALSALNRFREKSRTISEPTWLYRFKQQQEIMEPSVLLAETPSLSTFLSEKGVSGGLFLTGEVMFILRPLIYILLIRRYGARSWYPWLTSLGIDLIGNGLISFITILWQNTEDFRLSNNETNELKRRKLLWALYLMRDPLFTTYTRQKLDGAQKLLEPVPIVGLLTEKLIKLLVGAQTRYTYMSGS